MKNTTDRLDQDSAQTNAGSETTVKLISKKQAVLKGLKFYFTGEPCDKNGHLSERNTKNGHCYECQQAYYLANKEDTLAKAKVYRENNKDKIAATKKEWHEDNKVEVAARVKAYRENNKEQIAAQVKSYQEANKEDIAAYQKVWREANKEEIAAKVKIYRENNKEQIIQHRKDNLDKTRVWAKEYRQKPHVKAANTCRNMLHRVLSLTSVIKQASTFKALGYTATELREHVEAQFDKNMNWENYGTYWELDHIVSISKLIKSGVTDPAIINALSNLMPITKIENREKSDKDMYLL